MAPLQEYPAGVADVLHPGGELDVLLYYGLIAQKLEGFLRGRELATRTLLPKGRIRAMMKRGSREPPLYVGPLARAVTPAMMRARERYEHLEEARHELSPEQALAWFYFPSRKYVEFYYATNREGTGGEISRVVYDVSPGRGLTPEDAMDATALLVQTITEDVEAGAWMRGSPLVAWTGGSFQVTLALKELQPAPFYRQYVEYTGKGRTLTDRLVGRLNDYPGVPVTGGRFRLPGHVLVDPSPTPSGNLSRVPLGSLIMEDALTIGGVSVPLESDQLHREQVTDLKTYDPGRIVSELDQLAKRLPG